MSGGYELCRGKNGRQFYMTDESMWSCFGWERTEGPDGKPQDGRAIGFKQYSGWREMAEDMVASGIENPFAPFARDWG